MKKLEYPLWKGIAKVILSLAQPNTCYIYLDSKISAGRYFYGKMNKGQPKYMLQLFLRKHVNNLSF